MSMNNDRSQCIYTERLQTEKISLILSDRLLRQVNFLHKRVGTTEWSGILLYKIESGSIEDPANLVLKADYVYPMDIGSSTYTEFDYDNAYMEMHDKIDIIQNGQRVYKIGTVHTHHSMGTFFSGTDTGELHTNSDKHNFYLSLIVNFACDYKAKVAMHAVADETVFTLKGAVGPIKKSFKTNDSLIIYDCEISLENEAWFNERYDELKKKKPATPVYSYPATIYPSGTMYPNYGKLDSIGHQSKLDYDNTIGQYDDIKKCISFCIDGESNTDIYNCLKRFQTRIDNLVMQGSDKTKLHTELVKGFSSNFKIYWKGKNKKKRDLGKLELDELANKTLNYVESYSFINSLDAIKVVKDSLNTFIIEYADH